MFLVLLCSLTLFQDAYSGTKNTPSSISQILLWADSLENTERYDEAIHIIQEALISLRNIDNPSLHGTLHNKIGRYYCKNGQETNAIAHIKHAIEFAKQANDSLLLGDALNNLGIAYEYTGSFDSAFFYYEKSLRIREYLKDPSLLSASFRNMAQILRVLRRLEEARFYCRESFKLITDDTDYKTTANIYNEMAYLFELDNQLDSAKYYYRKLIEISIANDFKRGISVGYTNLASVYEQERDFESALKLMQKGLALDKQSGNIYGEMTSYNTLASYYILLEQYQKALIYLDSATRICDTSWKNNMLEITRAKYLAYKGIGDFKKALFFFEQYSELKDTIFSEQNKLHISEILARYETDKKEQKIEILIKTNEIKSNRIRIQILIIILAIFISVSGALASLIIIMKKNQRIRQMELELRNFLLHLKNPVSKSFEEEIDFEDPVTALKNNFHLTQREAEILELLAQGLINHEIALRLFISENTVKFHIKNIYIKLNVSNRVQALQKITNIDNQS